MIALTHALITAAMLVVAPLASVADQVDTVMTLSDIEWRVTSRAAKQTGAASLHLSRGERSNATIPTSAVPALSSAIDGGRSGPISFAIDREAGSIRCTGTLGSGAGRGTCRFASSQAFEQGLKARRLSPKSREDLFAMALVDATLARADALKRAGVAPDNTDDLIAAAALNVSGDYASGLRRAGLKIDAFDDLIACRALGIDAAFVRGLADAGYDDLSAQHAIRMKAVGVTPAYARAVNAAARRPAKAGGTVR